MASITRAPKQWQPTTNESLNSFTNWKESLVYTLSLDPGFSPFLADGVTWKKKSAANPTRGLNNDPRSILQTQRLTAVQKNAKP